MFTGIISDRGVLRTIDGDSDKRLVIATAYSVESIAIGASIACSGVCLTVVEKDDAEKNGCWLAFDVSAETLACTTLGDWRVGEPINLERPLRLGDELGGHMVLGHVDGVARIEANKPASEPNGDSRRLSLAAPEALAGFIAAKGSVALDGVSLTVNRVEKTVFEVNIIPHTLAVTTLGGWAAGGRVNLEIDILARYIARQQEWTAQT
jgi:riboflavin synthase